MKKVLVVLATLIAMSSVAHADGYGHGRRHHHGGWNHHHGGHNNWAAPLIGGLIIGGVIGAMNQPRYYRQVPAYRVECQMEPVFDPWGRYLGDRQQCYRIPNY